MEFYKKTKTQNKTNENKKYYIYITFKNLQFDW